MIVLNFLGLRIKIWRREPPEEEQAPIPSNVFILTMKKTAVGDSTQDFRRPRKSWIRRIISGVGAVGLARLLLRRWPGMAAALGASRLMSYMGSPQGRWQGFALGVLAFTCYNFIKIAVPALSWLLVIIECYAIIQMGMMFYDEAKNQVKQETAHQHAAA